MTHRNIYKELFNLVRKHGEKLVVINPETDDAVVVLPLDDYHRLLERGTKQIPSSIHSEKMEENQHNFSFWDAQDEDTPVLDNTVNNGRIEQLGKINTKIEKTPHSIEDNDSQLTTIHESDETHDDDAGGGYVFEPIDTEEHPL